MKIGLEIHCQINTKTKAFCSCPTQGNEQPNTRCCEICTGQPGSKPSLNKEALWKALKVAKALNCIINKTNFFSRKSYFYPDLAKNYQISQYELPLAIHGDFQGIKISRIHLEEDPGALIHKENYCLIDYNRSGIPLIEVVTEPDIESPKQAREFLKQLITVLEYLEVYDKKSEATLKADLNISTTGEKVEIKNVNGLQDIELALEYEGNRQLKQPAKQQETRGWNSESRTTFLQRTKESEADYGYIAEPDLPIIVLSEGELALIKIPELATEKSSRFQKSYKIDKADAEVLSKNKKLADLFEQVSKKVSAEIASKWVIRDIVKQCNITKKRIEDLNIKPQNIIELLSLFEKKQITDNTAKEILRKLVEESPFSPEEYIRRNNLLMKSDNSKLESWCKEAIKQSPEAVQEYKSGNQKSLNFIMGKVMQLSNKTANPQEVVKTLKRLINK
ncbi:MAG TPA: Asp-tRNA(Asn)/Glu-tRNA(Gln) amidotransferase subunit GatB [Candidatus Nanoarchaeia archaeon]|nr:Asp-tRNA(Asn)/Glu-tRNA(Gln) amidotransferase subunit GatB [Candidatus Nanoarchaeia archaeon]